MERKDWPGIKRRKRRLASPRRSSTEFGLGSKSKQEKAKCEKERRPTDGRKKGVVLRETRRTKKKGRRKLHNQHTDGCGGLRFR
jgi:hypothetical protein